MPKAKVVNPHVGGGSYKPARYQHHTIEGFVIKENGIWFFCRDAFQIMITDGNFVEWDADEDSYNGADATISLMHGTELKDLQSVEFISVHVEIIPDDDTEDE